MIVYHAHAGDTTYEIILINHFDFFAAVDGDADDAEADDTDDDSTGVDTAEEAADSLISAASRNGHRSGH